MKRLLLTTAAAVLIALVEPTALPASDDGVVTERYYAFETWSSVSDIGRPNPGDTGPGDVYLSRQRLSTLDGRRVGTAHGYIVGLRAPFVFSHWTAMLPKGTLTLEGATSLRTTGTQRFVIVGGSGGYDGARGTVSVSDAGKNGSLAVVRYRV
jgi:Allene oxide cyclase barrel like domain